MTAVIDDAKKVRGLAKQRAQEKVAARKRELDRVVNTEANRLVEIADAMAKTKAKPAVAATAKSIAIPAPNFEVAEFVVVGTAPLVQNKFSAKAREMMKLRQELGGLAKKGVKREAKDFRAAFEGACHRGPNGEYGVPAAAFRCALIDACRMCDVQMTVAKMCVFVEHDFVGEDGTMLVRLDAGDPEYMESLVKNDSGVADIRPRPIWREWRLKVRVKYNASRFTLSDVANLMLHAGTSVGICEGRPFSKDSAGCGWGTFSLASD